VTSGADPGAAPGVLAWVVGQGGLLGSHLWRELGASPGVVRWQPGAPFPWPEVARTRQALAAATARFFDAAANFSGWVVLWAAGQGVVASERAALDRETEVLETLLLALGARPDRGKPGTLFYASSAGGVYGGSVDRPITEASTPHPRSDYGHCKLEQEGMVLQWAEQHRVACLLGRLSTLYGVGQNLEKPQGLISQMSRCAIQYRPIHIYVPMDTVRDYLFVPDAARSIVPAVLELEREQLSGRPPRRAVKLLAAEQNASIAYVIRVFAQLLRRRPLVVQARTALAEGHPRQLVFRSLDSLARGLPRRTPLYLGIRAVHDHQLALFRRARLPRL
jgi:UDP-glucose 4-epimerase